MALPQVSDNTLNRIATLLASGLKAAQVASIVGVSPPRISQISQEESFQLLLSEKLAEASKKDVEEAAITAKYLTAEHLLIDQMMQMAPSAELRDVTAALRVVAERQEKALTRKNPIHASTVVHQNIVQLQLPTHALPEIAISKDNEVLQINHTNMAPLTSQGVKNLFSQLKENQNVQGRILEGTSSNVTASAEESCEAIASTSTSNPTSTSAASINTSSVQLSLF